MRCYSDHNEDVRTKGACDCCGGTEVDVCDLCMCAYCVTYCPCVAHQRVRSHDDTGEVPAVEVGASLTAP